MCGNTNARASRGGLMAAMLPFLDTNPTNQAEFVLSFQNPEASQQTHAELSISDSRTLEILRNVPTFTMRIEKYGHLMNKQDLQTNEPLFCFALSPRHDKTGAIAFEIPYKLDFAVSESGIVGRQATLLSSGEVGTMDVVGKGVIGWN